MSRDRKGFTSPSREAAKKKLDEQRRKSVVATNIETNEELKFVSVDSASKALDIDPSNISRVCRGEQNRKQSKGWKFRYE